MIVVYATDRNTQVRKSWDLDFRECPEASTPLQERGHMVGLTDCVWIVPGTLDLDA